jgi:hypothetical protein
MSRRICRAYQAFQLVRAVCMVWSGQDRHAGLQAIPLGVVQGTDLGNNP